MSLFNPSRDEVRDFFFNCWKHYLTEVPMTPIEQIAASVIKMHPEYHTILGQPDLYREQAYFPELGETNPFLHMSLHLSILEQISINQPHGIQPIYARVVNHYQDEHQAQHVLIECLAETIWLAQKNQTSLDGQHYLTLLQQRANSIA